MPVNFLKSVFSKIRIPQPLELTQITEGFHRKMKLIQRLSCGHKNFENYRLRVLVEYGVNL